VGYCTSGCAIMVAGERTNELWFRKLVPEGSFLPVAPGFLMIVLRETSHRLMTGDRALTRCCGVAQDWADMWDDPDFKAMATGESMLRCTSSGRSMPMI
jgi:hypothetical protein